MSMRDIPYFNYKDFKIGDIVYVRLYGPMGYPDDNIIWEGVNKDVQEWHDHYYTHPNFFFLLYWSDIQKNGEGSVWFTDLCHDVEYEVKPTSGTLIAVNNNGKFLHRVDPSKNTRVLAEFYFDIKEFENIVITKLILLNFFIKHGAPLNTYNKEKLTNTL